MFTHLFVQLEMRGGDSAWISVSFSVLQETHPAQVWCHSRSLEAGVTKHIWGVGGRIPLWFYIRCPPNTQHRGYGSVDNACLVSGKPRV